MAGNTATIFNIERFSHEDGPGIRSVVFLKGCPLRCVWCSNPESRSRVPQILHKSGCCASCGRCVEICPSQGVSRNGAGAYVTDMAKCVSCHACIDACYAGARQLMGGQYTLEQLFAEVEKDIDYYRVSKGGITFSGGEPLLQADFIAAFARRARKSGFDTLVETCGQVPTVALETVNGVVDFIYYDCKHMDPERHKALTGVDNRLILDNLRWLDAHFSGFLAVRYPYIPGMNDDPVCVDRFVDFVATLRRVRELWFLPYHRLGQTKYHGLGLEYPMGATLPLRIRDVDFLRQYQNRLEIPIKI